MWDESDENKKVSCPFCDSEENCPHLLAVTDGSSLVGGFAYDHEASFYSRVYDAFQKRLAEGNTDQEWSLYELDLLWESIREEKPGVFESGDADLSSGLMSDLLFVVLDVAGGSEYQGNAISRSGGNSESATRLMYAEDPAATCVNALTILDEYLAEKVPPKKRKKKR